MIEHALGKRLFTVRENEKIRGICNRNRRASISLIQRYLTVIHTICGWSNVVQMQNDT